MAAAVAAGFYTAGAVTGWATCTATGSALGGATWGGVYGGVAGGAVTGAGLSAANGGDLGDTLRGAFWGGVTGGAFAGVNAGFGGRYGPGRVVADATVGGVSSRVQGGDFWRGAGMSGLSSGAEYAYREIVQWSDGVKHPSTWRSGKGTVAKDDYSRPVYGLNNTGTQHDVGFWAEGGRISELLNKVPGIAAVSGLHDTFQIRFAPGFVRTWVVNVPGMVVAAGMTYPALMRGTPSVGLATREDD